MNPVTQRLAYDDAAAGAPSSKRQHQHHRLLDSFARSLPAVDRTPPPPTPTRGPIHDLTPPPTLHSSLMAPSAPPTFGVFRFEPEELALHQHLVSQLNELRRTELWLPSRLSDSQARAQYIDDLDKRAITFLAVALSDHATVLGCAQYDRATGRLRQVAVAPAHRGLGVGSALVSHVVDEAVRHSLSLNPDTDVEHASNNESALEAATDVFAVVQVNALERSSAFYASQGFRRHSPVYTDAQQDRCVIMMRVVKPIVVSQLPPLPAAYVAPSTHTNRNDAAVPSTPSPPSSSDAGAITLHSPINEPPVPAEAPLVTETPHRQWRRLRLMLVRHGESNNNALMAQAREALGPDASQTAMREFYVKHRSHDPPLSPVGMQHAKAVGAHVGEELSRAAAVLTISDDGTGATTAAGTDADRGSGSNTPRVVVWSSPMLRALQTASAIEHELTRRHHLARYLVHGRMFEYGGCACGGKRYDGLSPNEIHEAFPAFRCVHPREWIAGEDGHGSVGWWLYACQARSASSASSASSSPQHLDESLIDFSQRVVDFTAELWHAVRTLGEVERENERTLILVAHGIFFDLLLKSLLRMIPRESTIDASHPTCDVRFVPHNTGVSMLELELDETSNTSRCYMLEFNNTQHLAYDPKLRVGGDVILDGWQCNYEEL